MNKYIIDSYAWMEYLEGTPKGEHVKKIVENKENEIYTVHLSFAEITSRVKRKGENHEHAVNTVLLLSKVPATEIDTSVNAGLIHAEIRSKVKDFGLTDSFILATARKINAKILTGDPHFKNLKEAVII